MRIVPLLLFLVTTSNSLFSQTVQEYKTRIDILRSNIQQHFIDKKTGYYLEKDFRKEGEMPYSFLWPLCGLVQASNEWEQLYNKTDMLDSVLTSIQAYYDPSLPAPGYGSYVVKEKREDRYYDDNQWIGIACMDAYERTKQKKYLEEGTLIYQFMMTGYDTVSGGGLYWKERDGSTKNTCSNGPGVILAIQLYKATGKKAYLDTAIMIYDWTKKWLLSPEWVYYDNLKLPSRTLDKRTYTYNTGTMLQSSVLLFKITKDKKYFAHAQELARGSLKKFYKDNSFPSHYWFNAVLLRGYIDLYKTDGNKDYLLAMREYGETIWNRERNSTTNLIGKKAQKELIDQAAVMEIYARLAMLKL